jgi:hypothetical protein
MLMVIMGFSWFNKDLLFLVDRLMIVGGEMGFAGEVIGLSVGYTSIERT